VAPFLIELRLAEHADVNLRRHLIRILGFVLAVPAADRFYILLERFKEVLPSRGYVSAESLRVIISAKQNKMIQMQKCLSVVAE